MSKVDDAIQYLSGNKRGLRGSELTEILESLRFKVRPTKKVGHRVVSHPELLGASGNSSFTVGHGKDDEVRLPYVVSIITMLKTNKDELEQLPGIGAP